MHAVPWAAWQGAVSAEPGGSNGACRLSPLLLKASAWFTHVFTSSCAERGLAHTALQRVRSGNTAPPRALVRAAVMSWRTSWSRLLPCGETHKPSTAEWAWSTSTSVMLCPQTVSPPAPVRIDCVIAG